MSFSYSFRDRPRLSDRIRGKSGDELFNELRKEFDQDSKSFFGRPSSNFGASAGSTFPRAAHFFDEAQSPRGRTDIRSHLEDLAQRHPEFADHLRYPAWTDDQAKTNTWGRKRRGSQEKEEVTKQQNKEENDSLRGRAKENLRNTVPDMGQKQQQTEEESRGQRSWSAPPPDNRTEKPRFVSKINLEINQPNPEAQPQPQQSSSTGDATKPPMAPPKPQPQPQANQQQPQHKTSTVRHIPIFVEGRDEPLLPKVEQEFTEHAAPQQHYAPPPQRKQTPPKYDQNQPRFEQQVPIQTRFEKEVPIQPRFEKEIPVQSRFEKEVPIQTHQQQQHHQHPPPQQQQYTQHYPPQQQQAQPEPQNKPPVNPNDPLYRVECVQKEVDELKTRIENFKGTSRKDKEYIYLDELLTRNLIKLDNIETEGKEEVRAARKNTIKSIQKYISDLENKVPLPVESEVKKVEDDGGEKVEEKPEAMETEQQIQSPGDTDNQQNPEQIQPKTESKQNGERPMEVEPQKTTDGATAEFTDPSIEQPPAAETSSEVKEPSSNEASENKSA